MDMDISMDIHVRYVDMDMDMDVKIHIHGNPGLHPCAKPNFIGLYSFLLCRPGDLDLYL